MRPKVESYLGFAKKSRNLVEGAYSCESYIKKKKVHLVILAEDLGGSSKKNIEIFCQKENIEVETIFTKEELGKILGKKEIGVLGITDKNFAKVIKDEIEKERCQRI